MVLFHIVCAAIGIVIAPNCPRQKVIIGGAKSPGYLKLEHISTYLGSIVPRDAIDAPLEFRVLTSAATTMNSQLFGGPLRPRTPPGQWMFWRHFSEKNEGVYVVTEGQNRASSGRLVGFALVSAHADSMSTVSYMEIDKMSMGMGISHQLTTNVLSLLQDRGEIVDLLNVIEPINDGAQMYLTSAQQAGYKFAHILQTGSRYVTMPLVDNLEQTTLFKNFDWNSPDTINDYVFTMGEHAFYRVFPVETVNELHILHFNGRRPPFALRRTLEPFIPLEWKTTIDGIYREFSMFFAFSPQATAEPLGMVLIKVGDVAHNILSFSAKDANDERALLQVTFLDALRSLSSVEIHKKKFSHWNTVVEAATSHGYSADDSLVDDVVFVPKE